MITPELAFSPPGDLIKKHPVQGLHHKPDRYRRRLAAITQQCFYESDAGVLRL